jgi:hypothetical protein
MFHGSPSRMDVPQFSAAQNGASNLSSSENLREAQVVIDRSRQKDVTTPSLVAFGIAAIVLAITVLGVCLSGNCRSNDSSKIPPATYSPTASPTVPPID